jgi:hypothetical protein
MLRKRRGRRESQSISCTNFMPKSLYAAAAFLLALVASAAPPLHAQQVEPMLSRGDGPAKPVKVKDAVHSGDVLQTGNNGAIGVTFNDETTFNLSAGARLVVDEFVYQAGGKDNAAVFKVTRGTVAFIASQVAKTGDMRITTPTATLGIRGTTGVVEVPDSVAAGGLGEAKIKLYADADGAVGRIEVYNPQGNRLGILSQAASAFAIRPGGPLRFSAVPFQIAAREAARDRGLVQRLFSTHSAGRRLLNLRLNRLPNLQRQPAQQLQRQLQRLQQPNQKLQTPRMQTTPTLRSAPIQTPRIQSPTLTPRLGPQLRR